MRSTGSPESATLCFARWSHIVQQKYPAGGTVQMDLGRCSSVSIVLRPAGGVL